MSGIRTLSIDIETYSDVDLKKSGVYPYAESPNFELLLFGYSVNGGPARVADIRGGEELPEDILDALTDDGVLKWAFNAQFERVCLSAWLRRAHPGRFRGYGDPEDTTGDYLSPASWRCSRVWCAYLGLPVSLAGAGEALRLDEGKMSEGGDLVRYFCGPCRPTKANGGRTRNLPAHAPEKWEAFRCYNRRDVETELRVKERLANFPVPEFLWEEYALDQQINDRGILVDGEFARRATDIDGRMKENLRRELREKTGLENPNSVQQMKSWLSAEGVETESLDKKTVRALLPTVEGVAAEVLSCRQKLARSSVSKYTAMENAVCADGRARGMFQFYGGARTGRWAGRLIQLQNLPQNHMEDLAEARRLVRDGDFAELTERYDDIPAVLSELIRTAFIPKPGYKYVVADFSAIEARVLSFIAGEKWRTEVFREGGDIYCASATKMFGVPVVKNGVNGHLRQKGKIAELALGYGGSVGALRTMGALELGLEEEELRPLVDAWRAANPNITRFWRETDEAVKNAVAYGIPTELRGFGFRCRSGLLLIDLPSGRSLCYARPRMCVGRFGSEAVSYEGMNSGKWTRIESYGPKFTENIVQAVARDILACAMRNLRDLFIVGSVHDELIIECRPEVSVRDICERVSETPPWIAGLLLRADGYECGFYRKE